MSLDTAGVVKLRILRWERSPAHPGAPSITTRSLQGRRVRVRKRLCNDRSGGRNDELSKGRKRPHAKNASSLQVLEKAKKQILPKSFRKECWHLDLGPARPISNP